jgi:hypothetical protein
MESNSEMRQIMRNQTNAYMIQGEKMSCICLYVNPMRKILLDSGSFREKKRTTMICSQLSENM